MASKVFRLSGHTLALVEEVAHHADMTSADVVRRLVLAGIARLNEQGIKREQEEAANVE